MSQEKIEETHRKAEKECNVARLTDNEQLFQQLSVMLDMEGIVHDLVRTVSVGLKSGDIVDFKGLKYYCIMQYTYSESMLIYAPCLQ